MALARKTLGIRKNLKGERRRAQIKEAAINVFSTKGFDQATMDDLVQEAGVSKSLIYWYWPSKSALLSELVETCMVPYVELLKRTVASTDPFMDKFHRLLWDYLALSKKSDKLNRLVHYCSLHHSKRQEENLSVKVNRYYKEVLSLLEALARQAVDQGFLPRQQDIEAAALALLSVVEGYIYMSLLEERMPLERMMTMVFNLIVGPMKDDVHTHYSHDRKQAVTTGRE